MDTLTRSRMINGLLILLLILVAWLSGKLFWTFTDSPNQVLVVPALQESLSVNQQKGGIAPVYLFGRVEYAADEPPIISQENVKKTSLNLKLLGVLVAPGFGVAIIENSGKSESYSLEETIQNGVVLKEVYPSYVVLNHNGLLEKLQMVEEEDVFTQSTDAPELNQRQLTILKHVKENALKNPITIMRYVRFEMVQQNGKVDSVKVWPQKEKEIFLSLGFKAGDELKSVNGYSVAELTKSPALWQELLKQTNLDLTVIRDGQTQNLLVQLD